MTKRSRSARIAERSSASGNVALSSRVGPPSLIGQGCDWLLPVLGANLSDAPLTESLAALSRFFVGDGTLHETLQRVTDLSVAAVDGADLAGISGRPQ